MIEEIIKKLKEKTDVRKSLSDLRQIIKEPNQKLAFQYQTGNNINLFLELLEQEDPKVRKNAALLMGDLKIQEAVDLLYESYCKEDKLFVKSSYLIALGNLNCKKYLEEFKARIAELSQIEITDENKKHVSEELKELTNIMIRYEGIKRHGFTGYHKQASLIMLTNRNHAQATVQQLEGIDCQEFNAGIMLTTNQIEKVFSVRTCQEVLFIVPGMKTCTMDASQAASTIVSSSLLKFLMERHDGTAPFYFRVEVKSKMPLDKKSEFAKKLAAEIELRSERKFINSTSNYEIEIRLVQNKEGSFNLLVKLFTIEDDRFQYRQNTTASSIKPTNAALVMELAKDYLKEEGKVLDPFCGVGTMLIERHKKVKANTMYGIDRQEDAIEGARENTKLAHQIAHYINKDFFEFTHEYLFDEVVTNMPFQAGRTTQEEIDELYEGFFGKIKEHLTEDGIIILYSHDKELARKLAISNGFKLVEMFEISKKEETFVLVFRRIG